MKKCILILGCLVLVGMLLATCVFAEEAKKENVISLTLFERNAIQGLLPTRVNYVQGVMVNALQKKVLFTQEEIEKYTTALPDGRSQWTDNTYKIEVTITKLEAQILKEAIEKLDNEKKIIPTDRFLALYEKIKALK